MMIFQLSRDTRWTHAVAALFFFGALAPDAALMAQGMENKKALDTIIGSDVEEEKARADAEAARIIAAIDNTVAATSEVRKTSSLDKVDIVFLTDAAETGLPPAIDAKVKEHHKDILDLRKELEGNAMLYHAIDSRSVLMRDVLAVEFNDHRGVTIYAAAKPQK